MDRPIRFRTHSSPIHQDLCHLFLPSFGFGLLPGYLIEISNDSPHERTGRLGVILLFGRLGQFSIGRKAARVAVGVLAEGSLRHRRGPSGQLHPRRRISAAAIPRVHLTLSHLVLTAANQTQTHKLQSATHQSTANLTVIQPNNPTHQP